MVETSADEKVREATHYLWKKWFPRHVESYLESRDIADAKEAA